MTWAPLHQHSSMSLLDGIAQPRDMARRCVELGYASAALTDHGGISGVVEFSQEMRKQGVKPILGNEIYLSRGPSTDRSRENGRPYSHLVVLSRNAAGWKDLIKLTSFTNDESRSYYSPRIQLEELREFTAGGNLLAFSGHPGSDLGNVIFKSPKHAYNCTSYDEIKSHHLHEDAQERLRRKIEEYVSVFGRDNFHLEVQLLKPETMPASIAIAKALRWAARKYKLRAIATADSHYVRREDAADQRILLCSKLNTSLSQVRRRIENEEDVELGGFFKGDCFHIPSAEEMLVHHAPEEVRAALDVAAEIEDYEITCKPRIPTFPLTGGATQEAFLRGLCDEGWRRLIEGRDLPRSIEVYRDRLDMELGVIEAEGLSGYFLIVQDVVNYVRSKGRWPGRGRGSAAGCLVSYLAGITAVDPLMYDLMFERFFNAARKGSMPDIDVDIPITMRQEVFERLSGMYGRDRVGKIATFQTMQGASALDAVLRAHDVPFDLCKEITKIIPSKDRISEELQAMAERGETPSAIRFALETYPADLSEWATLDDDGSISGEFAPYFAQAIRLEGVKKAKSTHAAGVVISDVPLAEVAPIRYEDGSLVADMEYGHLEALGCMKLDVLGVAMLDKLESVRNLVGGGRLRGVA